MLNTCRFLIDVVSSSYSFKSNLEGGRKVGIEVIAGCMASGKTEELMRRLRRAQIAKQKIQVFRSVVDERGDSRFIETLDGRQWPAITVEGALKILDLVKESTTVVAIDDAQFFDRPIVGVCQSLSEQGKRVIVAGLDTDFCGEPFGPVPDLLAIAPDVTKLTAVCMVCGGEATRSQRLINGQSARYDAPLIAIGWVASGQREAVKEIYEPRCALHHEVGGIEELRAELYGIPK